MKKPGEIEDFEINKQFTDRNEARSLFWQWYKKTDDNRDDFFVLSYYGIGGIGKSSLIDQLCREMEYRSKRYVKYDFEDAKGLDPYSILIDLKQSIRNRYGNLFRFPLFNAALLMLAKKSSVNFENDELVKSVVAESPHLQAIVNTLSLIPLVGGYLQNAVTIISQLSADVDNLNIKAELKKKYKQYIDTMVRLEADELRKKMPQYFWTDMAENMKGLSEPFVIFLDTYEKYIDTFKASSNVVLDSWLRESTQSLIQRIPGILWVICGRDRLTWGDDGEWDEEHLACYEICDFANLNSIAYMNRAGITDGELVAHICNITKGVPIYLELCVDTYYLLKDKGVSPNAKNFEVDRRKIANRYVKYLDHVNRELVYILACMGEWQDDEAKYVAKEVTSKNLSMELYNEMIKHSLFKTDSKGKWRMHNIVVDGLLSEIDESTLSDINSSLFHYRVKKLVEESLPFNDVIPMVYKTVECFCRITRIESSERLFADFRILVYKITELRRHGFIHDCLKVSIELNKHCSNVFTDTVFDAESCMMLCEALWSVGEYELSLKKGMSSYKIRCDLLGKNHLDTLQSLYSIAVIYCAMGHYKEALKIALEVYESRKSILGEDHPDTIESLHSISNAYNYLGQYEKGLKIEQKVYELRKRNLGEDHPDTLGSLHNIGVYHSQMGQDEEALKIMQKVYEARKNILGQDHPKTVGSLHNIGTICNKIGQCEEALKIMQKVYEARRNSFGENHPDTLSCLHNIGVAYRRIGQYEKALETDKQVYETRRRVLGEEHPDTLSSLNNIGADYSILGRYEEALETDRQVYEIRKRVLGEEHPDTLSSLNNIGADYSVLGKHEEALEIFERSKIRQ